MLNEGLLKIAKEDKKKSSTAKNVGIAAILAGSLGYNAVQLKRRKNLKGLISSSKDRIKLLKESIRKIKGKK